MFFRAQPQTAVILSSSADRWRIAVGRYPPTYAHSSPGLAKAKKRPHKHAEAAGKHSWGCIQSREGGAPLPAPHVCKEHMLNKRSPLAEKQVTLRLDERCNRPDLELEDENDQSDWLLHLPARSTENTGWLQEQNQNNTVVRSENTSSA